MIKIKKLFQMNKHLTIRCTTCMRRFHVNSVSSSRQYSSVGEPELTGRSTRMAESVRGRLALDANLNHRDSDLVTSSILKRIYRHV